MSAPDFRHDGVAGRARRHPARLLTGLVLLALAACSGQRPSDEFIPWPEEPPPQANGAIYQEGRDIALFANATARRIGDTVTVRLIERTDAQKSSSTTTSKSTSVNFPGPIVAGRPVTVNGTEILRGSVANEAEFDGAGDSRQSNRLTGDITVTVMRRLPNGNLFVRGEKWISINQGSEFVRLEGVIRPIDIEPDNSVPSYKVANAVISYGGKGALADANRPGWLSRFFNSPLLPF